MTAIDASLRALEIQGTTVPKLGFGTWEILGRDCEEAVADALEIGYRHIDTAQAYDNEAEVGKALRRRASPRKELFLTTKLWRDEFAPDRVRASAEGSLREARRSTASTSCSCTGRTTRCRSRRRSGRSRGCARRD